MVLEQNVVSLQDEEQNPKEFFRSACSRSEASTHQGQADSRVWDRSSLRSLPLRSALPMMRANNNMARAISVSTSFWPVAVLVLVSSSFFWQFDVVAGERESSFRAAQDNLYGEDDLELDGASFVEIDASGSASPFADGAGDEDASGSASPVADGAGDEEDSSITLSQQQEQQQHDKSASTERVSHAHHHDHARSSGHHRTRGEDPVQHGGADDTPERDGYEATEETDRPAPAQAQGGEEGTFQAGETRKGPTRGAPQHHDHTESIARSSPSSDRGGRPASHD